MELLRVLDRFWQLISGVLTLNGDTFRAISHLPLSWIGALLVVLLAGLSQGIGQSAVLFINRVRPLRFVLSLAIAAVIFVFNYNFWVLSTWIVADWMFGVSLPLVGVIEALGFSYAPLLLGFLMVIPYFGMPISLSLSIWTLLAIVTGIKTIAPLGLWQVFQCCIGGWLVSQISQRIFGKRLAIWIDRLLDWIAGVDLVRERSQLEEMLYSGLPIPPEIDEIPNFLGNSGKDL
jgi:hypothetical protein